MSESVTKQEMIVVPALRISSTIGKMVAALPSVGSPSDRTNRTDVPGRLLVSAAILSRARSKAARMGVLPNISSANPRTFSRWLCQFSATRRTSNVLSPTPRGARRSRTGGPLRPKKSAMALPNPKP
jgi:hypothetical protein